MNEDTYPASSLLFQPQWVRGVGAISASSLFILHVLGEFMMELVVTAFHRLLPACHEKGSMNEFYSTASCAFALLVVDPMGLGLDVRWIEHY